MIQYDVMLFYFTSEVKGKGELKISLAAPQKNDSLPDNIWRSFSFLRN